MNRERRAGVSQRPSYTPSKLRRALWFTAGADIALLIDDSCPESERMKYASIGGAMLLTTMLALISGEMAFYQIFFPGFNQFELIGTPWRISASLLFACGLMLVIYNMQRFLISGARREGDQPTIRFKDLVHALPGLVLSAMIGMTIATPLQVWVFDPEIDAELIVEQDAMLMRKFDAVEARVETAAHDLAERGVPSSPESTKKQVGSAFSTALQRAQSNCKPNELAFGIRNEFATARLKRCIGLVADISTSLRNQAAMLRAMQSHSGSARAADGEHALLHVEAELNWATLVYEKLIAIDSVASASGLIKRASVAYRVDPMFSCILVLAIIFVQATPVLIRVMSPKGPYDDLMEMDSRKRLARNGIEPAAVVLRPLGLRAPTIDRYHHVRNVERATLLGLRGVRQRLSEERAAMYYESYRKIRP